MPRTLVFTSRRTAFKFQQRRIEPFALGNETLRFLLQRLQMCGHPPQFCLRSRSAIAPRNIAPGAFELDFRAAARTFIFQLHLIVPNHAFDQFVARQHPLSSSLQFGGFLGSHLWAASAGAQCDDFRLTSRTEEQSFSKVVLWDQNRAPMDASM